jgi:hypothetical protein
MSCDPVRLTGYVDGVLPAEELAEVEGHLEGCQECRRQVAEERALCDRLRELPAPAMPDAFEAEVRRRLHPAKHGGAAWALPLAASLVLLLLWARGSAAFVGWELARDHRHCFGQERLPAQIWTEDPGVVERWFEKQGTEVPMVPEGANGLELVGARYCVLLDRGVAHLYYSTGEHQASLFVLRGPARLGAGYEGRMGARTVMLFPVSGLLVGVVADRAEDAAALRRRFQTMTASLPDPEGAP